MQGINGRQFVAMVTKNPVTSEFPLPLQNLFYIYRRIIGLFSLTCQLYFLTVYREQGNYKLNRDTDQEVGYRLLHRVASKQRKSVSD
jgi:hypothetical protein